MLIRTKTSLVLKVSKGLTVDFGCHICFKAELKNKEKGKIEERRGKVHKEGISGCEVVSLYTEAPTPGRNNLGIRLIFQVAKV